MSQRKIIIMLIVSIFVLNCKHREEHTPPPSKSSVRDGFVLVSIDEIIEGVSPDYKLAGTSGDWKGVFVETRRVKLDPYAIAKYETTYKLWCEVRKWAENNGYRFANKGLEGGDGKNGGGDFPDYTNIGKEPTENLNLPCTMINWRDSIVWCNAYTHMLNGNQEKCVYKTLEGKVLQDSTEQVSGKFVCDSAIQDIEKSGFRLPTEAEWEMSARWQKDDVYAVKHGNIYLSKLDAGSGAKKSTGFDGYEFLQGETIDTLKDNLLIFANFGQYWKDDNWADVPGERKAIGVGNKKANDLGIFDMSGNVSEWCFDFYDSNTIKDDAFYTKEGIVFNPQGAKQGSLRCTRGGNWESPSIRCAVGYRKGLFDVPGKRADTLGFRICYSVR